MLRMQTIDTIKTLYRTGMSIREIHRKTGFSRNTITKYLNGASPGYRRTDKAISPKKLAIRPIIEQWLLEDESVPRKQRRTRTKIFKDLVDQHDFDGSYATVKEVVREIIGTKKEVFVPRHYNPGVYGEFDFGELYIDIGGTRTKVYLHAFQLPYSNDRFGYLSLRQTQEEMFESHKRAFDYYDGVPTIMRYDNLKQAVNRILKGSFREENSQFIRFREQFGYEAEFCEVGKGNQKGDVEGCVGYIRRNFFSPVIQLNRASELEKLNQRLADWCIGLRATMTVPGTSETVETMFKAEKEHLNLIPHRCNDVGKWGVVKSNHQSLVSVDHNFYSVPVRYAHQQLDILITAREVIIYAKEKEIARHKRCFEKEKAFYEPLHYIPIFKKKPYALLNGKPLQGLPPAFGRFFATAYHKGYGTLKQCVDVIGFLQDYSQSDVAAAIELAMAYESYHSDSVKNLLTQFKTDQPAIQKLSHFKRADCETVSIPSVNLYRYNALANQEGRHV